MERKLLMIFTRSLAELCGTRVGMARDEKGLKEAMNEIKELREEFWKDVTIVGQNDDMNQTLERAGRVVDYLELGELMALMHSTGMNPAVVISGLNTSLKMVKQNVTMKIILTLDPGSLKVESKWNLHKEPLEFEYVKPAIRSYK
jgi:succinate dehydrogenase / fumarate reductase, flavoprotein subunit